MADDEFEDDNIDWTAVDLPSASGSIVGRQQQMRGGLENNVHNARNHAGNNSTGSGSTAAISATNRAQTTTPHSEENQDSLRLQIKLLQDQLEAKDDQIFELEATAATSAVESSALVQRAEEDARHRIHLIEEELRRVKREADQYKGQWVRVKKRVVELEVVRGGGNAADEFDSSRAITPSNADHHFHNHFQEDFAMVDREKPKSPGVKRKFHSDQDDENSHQKKESASFIASIPVSHKYDSVRQRIIKHLLLCHEMGCYSMEKNLKHLSAVNGQINTASQFESAGNCERKDARSQPDEVETQGVISCSAQALAIQVERETVSFVKSILCHMMLCDSTLANDYTPNVHGVMSVSGLARVLMERFNSLFVDYCADRQEQESMETVNQSCTKQDQDVVLVLYSDRAAQTKVNYTTHSWRAVLYLLLVLQDILLLSGKTRDDLRWWFYQSRQCDGSRSSTDGNDTPVNDIRQESQVNTRIEGLPPLNPKRDLYSSDRKEALWSFGCGPVANKDDAWDASTMALPCNTFYEIIVGLMKGHIYPSQGNRFTSDAAKEVAQYAQIKSIDFVSRLMSDAAPYDQADLNWTSKTPHLWNFWFDSLFPTYSSKSGLSLDSSDVVDFFSLWEKSGDNHRGKWIGSGRRYHTQLPSSTAECKLIGEKQPSKSDKSKIITISLELTDLDLMVIDTKCRSLQLISQIILSSSSIHQRIYTVPSSLAKRVLFGVLDEVDEFIIPCIRSRSTPNQHVIDLGHCLELCYSCVSFLLVLSISDAGLHLLRIQTRLDFQVGGRSRWSSSAIACLTAILNAALLYLDECEDEDTTAVMNASHAPQLKRIVEQCILFFKNILAFVHGQQLGGVGFETQALSFVSLVAEEYNIFLSCCHRVIALKMFPDQLKYETRLFLEEVLLDDEE
ncbi:hypothetical protein HJC23_000738 [Cyclotella cryptica]|uniref:Uncharacterized protein n=1 Tax=Cyclotella cryptica TaxID=29204 RepID=A0ABD3Q9I4_9STRA|eukprot:CCRYP_007415-RA/>CCRYP_007415-RA protein AED:0.12 eAED:0.12 QI:215/1/1/1/0/0/2/965/906